MSLWPGPKRISLNPVQFCQTKLEEITIDDEPDTRAMLKAGLENCGAEVILAGSAAEAFHAIERQYPDVLISDIGNARYGRL